MNDETLGAGHTYEIQVKQPTLGVWLPVVGAMSYREDSGTETTVSPGNLVVSYLTRYSSAQISNPYQRDLIGLLDVRFKTPVTTTYFNQSFFSLM